jgi:hypothetical protein
LRILAITRKSAIRVSRLRISSDTPSAKYAWSWSGLRSANGRTAIDGFSAGMPVGGPPPDPSAIRRLLTPPTSSASGTASAASSSAAAAGAHLFLVDVPFGNPASGTTPPAAGGKEAR